jgi:hypothetical protein
MPNIHVLHWAMWTYAPTELLNYILADTAMVAMICYKGDCRSYDVL